LELCHFDDLYKDRPFAQSDKSLFIPNAFELVGEMQFLAEGIRAIASKSRFRLIFQIRQGLIHGARAPAQYMEAPSGLRITSPKDFHGLSSGFSRADSGESRVFCHFLVQNARII
jgi:hypothetical protein